MTKLEATGAVCPERCCVAVYDPTLLPDEWSSVYAVRPMYSVIVGDGRCCSLDDGCADFGGMEVPAAEYDRPDRIFL